MHQDPNRGGHIFSADRGAERSLEGVGPLVQFLENF